RPISRKVPVGFDSNLPGQSTLVFPLVVKEPDVAKCPAPETEWVNKSVMFTPRGEIAYQYVKHNLLVGPESDHVLRGPRVIDAIETPYGKLASTNCLDMEYLDFNRLAGQQGVDIMLSGAIDGTPSSHGNPLHSTMASYRTIEECFSLARGGFYGANIVTDYQGLHGRRQSPGEGCAHPLRRAGRDDQHCAGAK
ncbi:MAG TPA: nitrilase-related carbon-nitrogen hydrolase, partial [Anaerolineaceae bacterium]|nr:nitrilase-related carbon-nitrogen hydrolase [Anaerolineaceae bacterium]